MFNNNFKLYENCKIMLLILFSKEGNIFKY